MKKFFSVLLGVVALGPSIQAQDIWDLRRCVDYALANNISVKQEDINARRAALTLEQSKLAQYPSLSSSVSKGLNAGRSIDPTTNQFTQQQLQFTSFNLQASVNIFSWFSVKNTIAANTLEAEAARASVEKLKNDIALNVATSYLLVLVAQEQSNISRVAVLQTRENLESTRKKVDAGVLPELNLAELEAQLARDSSSLITSQATVQQNLLSLKAILNLDAAQPFSIDMPPIDMIPVESLAELQPEVVYALAISNLPQQKINELRIKSAQKLVQISKAQLYPSISAFGSMATNYANNKIPSYSVTPLGTYSNTGAIVNVGGNSYQVQQPDFKTNITTSVKSFSTQFGDNFRQNVGIGLSIPIFNAGQAKTAYQRSKLNVESVQLVKEQGERTLKQDIYRSYNDAVNSLQKFNATKKSVETAEKAYNFAQKRYELGLLTTVDYLTNQNNLTRAKIERALAQVDYVFRLKLLEFYKGKGMKL